MMWYKKAKEWQRKFDVGVEHLELFARNSNKGKKMAVTDKTKEDDTHSKFS